MRPDMEKQMVFCGLILICFKLKHFVSSVSFQRTVVFIRVETLLGENVFLRGGRRAACSLDVSKDACAIPVKHRLAKVIPHSSSFYHWSIGDNYIDWHGTEPGQGEYGGVSASGTPLIWTTSEKGGPVLVDSGFGYTDLNHFGSHFWMMDVDMDCSETDQGWFEFKVFITPQRGWESDILQTSTCGGQPSTNRPYSGQNHMAMCGKFNVFYYDNGGCIIDNVTTALSIWEHPNVPQACGHRLHLKVKSSSAQFVNPQPSKAIEESGKIKDVFQDSRPLSSLLEQIDPKRSSTGNEAFNEHIKSSSNSRFDHHKSALDHMEASPRILHGHPATKGRWPWMGEILYKGNHGCGAVLISSTWAITAGHCVRTATAFGSWGLLLRVGELDRQSISGSERDYFVKRIIKHPLFDKDDGSDVENDNDIALLELAYPIADIPGVTPICLPGPGMVDQFAGGDCWGTGWGKTDGNDPSKLQEVKMTVHTTAACSRDYGGRVSGRQLCAGGGNVSACSGDSGSPLSCVKDGWWHVAGVVSWGDDYCRGRPSVYTRISAHLDWIRRTTGLGKVSAPVVGY